MTGLYIHIPFCKRKCFYCDFVSVQYDAALADKYISALIKEALTYKEIAISTVYIGGGTPSVLSCEQLKKLIENIKNIFDISKLQEFTVELNPESAENDKLHLLYNENVSRLSFGLQTANDKLLENIGRLHNFDKFKQAYGSALKKGFTDINIDLMYGIQDQTLADWEKTLDTVLNFNSSHISLYPLTIEKGTKFYLQKTETNPELQRAMYETACIKFKNNNLSHYEISNWARDKKYSKHNKTYWQNNEYVGLGAAAASYYKRYRFKNNINVNEYINNILGGKDACIEKEYINDAVYNTETIMLGLRLSEGVHIKYFNDKKHIIDKYLKEGFLHIKNDRVSLTEEAFFLSNSIISDLI